MLYVWFGLPATAANAALKMSCMAWLAWSDRAESADRSEQPLPGKFMFLTYTSLLGFYLQWRRKRQTGEGGLEYTDEQKLVLAILGEDCTFLNGQDASDGGFSDLDDEREEAAARQAEEELNRAAEATETAEQAHAVEPAATAATAGTSAVTGAPPDTPDPAEQADALEPAAPAATAGTSAGTGAPPATPEPAVPGTSGGTGATAVSPASVEQSSSAANPDDTVSDMDVTTGKCKSDMIETWDFFFDHKYSQLELF